jgi:very-short-patch-repair endonuclease
MRRTTTTRTLVDLGQVESRDVVFRATMSALRRNLTNRSKLWSAASALGGPGRAGIPVLRDVLMTIGTDPPSDSDLESRGVLLIERLGWRPAVRQHEVMRPDGRKARLDFAWVENLFCIELHGRQHDAHERKRSDHRRDAMLRRLGWHIVYLCWEEIVLEAEATMAFLREEALSYGLR